jgi:peptidyl-prolyl cis-trans isomerase C
MAAWVTCALPFGGTLAQVNPVGTSADPVVATVNGEDIHASDIEDAKRFLAPEMRAYPMASLFDFLLKDLVDTKLAAGEARRNGLADEASLKRRLARISERVLRQELQQRRMAKEISEESLRKRYDKFFKSGPGTAEVWARHILLETRAKAMEVIKRLQKGENFVILAQKISTGPSAPSGGDLGYFTRERMVPEFSRAAFVMKKGQFTKEPVKTRFGWHVIKVEDRRSKRPPSFDQAKGEMRRTIAKEVSDQLVQSLRAKAKIEVFGPKGKK